MPAPTVVTTAMRPNVLGLFVTLIRTYGARGLRRRCEHELRRRMQWYKRAPNRLSYGTSSRRRVRYAPIGDIGGLTEQQVLAAVARADRVKAGWYEAFSHEWLQLPQGKDWHTHPRTKHAFGLDNWWKVPLLSSVGDIKEVWEPGRFSWAYDLVRAYAATSDLTYAAAFHARLADWVAANPPFKGPQWACGQEVAIRALAILHAEDALPLPSDDAVAHERIVSMLCWSGERIWDAVGYGLSQRNNHGISEAAGLIHLGLRLADIHPDAGKWLRAGKQLLEEQICDQFASDGWYSQHSFNYMRLALEQSLYAQWALSALGQSLSSHALARLDAAIVLLQRLVDPRSGVVPNHGANDGARVLPLSVAEYRDFRPLLTLAAIVRGTEVLEGISGCNYVSWWFGTRVRTCKRPDQCVASGSSGWVVVRYADWTVFLRAGRYRHRPSHLDALHLDVRFRDIEIITDPGTYSYNSPPPWNNGLASCFVHNGPVLDEQEYAVRGPHFLWLSWPSAEVLSIVQGADSITVAAQRGSDVRREVEISADRVRVVDTALNSNAKTLQVVWLLHPQAVGHAEVTASGGEHVDASPDSLIGWFSPTYGLRQPSMAVRARRHVAGADRSVETTIMPACERPMMSRDALASLREMQNA